MSTDDDGHQRSVHERLYKQETVCKKIATQLRKGIVDPEVQDQKRPKSGQSRATGLTQQRSFDRVNQSHQEYTTQRATSALNTSYQQKTNQFSRRANSVERIK